ncbi:calcium-activated chloride channel regulator 1-like [Phyllobates terribilis]|uniref:calcium-activated chloride channel regulator 1-like n=1 Tax=Phyllobates terribilis TaxID=111132 RepID=UPI003CCAA45A
MATWGVLALLGFQVFFFTTEASMVKCNAGAYDDIVIAIHPDVPEDVVLIEKIQKMVKEATRDLFNATRQRLYIRSAKILIPKTWSRSSKNRTRERYEKADVVIVNSFLRTGDAPYTRQYGGCGEKGQYIHLTPNFLLQEDLTSFYGPYGKVFVHEWAHLRWGVFEEHNIDQPFYLSGKHQIEATRCSVNINGTYRRPQSMAHSCVTRPCSIDHGTGLYAHGCTFYPDKNLFSSESIMYSPGLQPVSGFCDETNHNMEAPTMQNRMCDCHSTWDIIKNSIDIASSEPRENFIIPEPTLQILRYRERVITLLIDVSGSMSTNQRMQRVNQAADIFLTEAIAAGTYIGIVEFSLYPYIGSELLQITQDSDREFLKSRVPPSESNYGSDFCLGILTAFKVNQKSGSLHGTEILFLADGDNLQSSIHCFPEIEDSGVIIHIIALSKEASTELEQIADMTGGLKYFVTDEVRSNDLIDAFIRIANENGGHSSEVTQVESATINLNPEKCMSYTVYIDNSVGAETFFTVTWQFSEVSIKLEDPDGKIYLTANFTKTNASNLSRMKAPGMARRGTWIFTLCNKFTEAQVLGIVVTSKSPDMNLPPITVNVHMNKDTNKYPDPMIVYASVSQGLLPVKGAKVTAIITPEKGNNMVLELLDNGAGADTVKDDGIYSKYFFSFNVSGRYSLKVRVACAESECGLTHPKNRIFALPGFVENGKVMMNPSMPPEDDVLPALGALRRVAAGGSFMVSDVVYSKTDVYPPGKIIDLEAKSKADSIVLSWTAPGDDLDQGNALSYDLRVSDDIAQLRDNFESSAVVDITDLKPSSAGSRETFTFIPNHDVKDVTILYFALIAVDKKMQKSVPSNIAQAAIRVPTVPGVTQCHTQKSTTCTAKHIQVCDPGSTSAPKQPVKCPSKPKPICPTAEGLPVPDKN